jgi:parvulin-like peptidyl-prolyl isomerase
MRRLLAGTFVAVILAACGNVLVPPAAVVGGHSIRAKDVTAALDSFKASPQFLQAAQQSGPTAVARQFEQTYLARLIRRYILAGRARQMGIEISDFDVQRALKQIQSNFPTQAAFAKALHQQGLTSAELIPLVRDRIVEQRLRTKVTSDVAPTDAELRAFYHQHLDQYRQILVSHILVTKRPKAQRIVDQLHATAAAKLPALFAHLAKKFSTDKSSAAKGGALGPLTGGNFVAPFQKAAKQLKPGQVSDPVKTKFGWHVIFVHRHVQTYRDVRAQIAQQVAGPRQDREWQRWLIQSYRTAHVKVNPSYGTLDLQTQTIVDNPGSFPGAPPASPSPATPGPLTSPGASPQG